MTENEQLFEKQIYEYVQLLHFRGGELSTKFS